MMNCEHVKDLLSPYLDNALAEEERRTVAAHLETCSKCNALLADFRRFDTLLSQLPRVSPSVSLREKLFSSADYLELMGVSSTKRSEQTVPSRSVRTDTANRGQQPQLVALPGGRNTQRSSSLSGTQRDFFAAPVRNKSRQARWGQRILQAALVASVLLVLGVGGLIGWNLWQRQNMLASNTTAITPPAGLQQGPIPAGIRFLFLRNGALWSAPTDGSTSIVRLTPKNTTVASQWAVRPAQAGRSAGNMVAYIDLQQGFVHIIRSDSQNDSVIQQPLLKHGVQPSTVWNTNAGNTILNSLTWSNDGSMLAFVADPTGASQPRLYIYTVSTNALYAVALSTTGFVSHLVWSPDSIRIAFEMTLNGSSTLLDYNTQTHSALTLQTGASTLANAGDTVLSLNWSPTIAAPALTWSLGQAGLVHSIWLQRVGIGGTTQPTLLTNGSYTQAEYSQTGHNGLGSWLLVMNNAGVAGDIVSVNLSATTIKLTAGKQVRIAQWSPDGSSIDYFDTLTNGMGVFHVINITTGTDTLVASSVATTPLPAWSADSQRIVYSNGTQTQILDVRTPGTKQTLKLQGKATAFSWSPSTPAQLILSTGDGQQGVYLVDTLHGTLQQLDKQAFQGAIVWTEIP
jgi:Putative zinc-finger/WD40-like Beta Propeller Repeat